MFETLEQRLLKNIPLEQKYEYAKGANLLAVGCSIPFGIAHYFEHVPHCTPQEATLVACSVAALTLLDRVVGISAAKNMEEQEFEKYQEHARWVRPRRRYIAVLGATLSAIGTYGFFEDHSTIPLAAALPLGVAFLAQAASLLYRFAPTKRTTQRELLDVPLYTAQNI